MELLNLEFNWGNLSAFDMADRFWWSVTRGGYCTHGETFHREDEVLWWSKGGTLHGESEPRIRFLKELLYELPGVESGNPVENSIGARFERTEVREYNDRRYFIGDSLKDNGECLFRTVACGKMFHWPTSIYAELVWEHIGKYARNLETRELIRL